MKVLWFCSEDLSKSEIKATGTWLHTMSDAIVERGVELYCITQNADVQKIEYKNCSKCKQWVLPQYKLYNGLPLIKYINGICQIVDSIQPDIIHIWGTEYYWGLLYARGYIRGRVLLEIQGLKETCVRVFYGGLGLKDILKTIGIREIVHPTWSLIYRQYEFWKWSQYEREIIAAHHHISTHSDWVRSWIAQFVNSECAIHHTQRIVRKEFLKADAWLKPNNSKDAPVIFALSSGADAYKGIHDAIRAIGLLKRHYPNIQLRIAGNFGIEKTNIRKPGYTKYLLKLIKINNLDNNVLFLGSINASQIVEQLSQSNAMLQTSYVESYSLAVAEAMMYGIPLVVSYAGAMPELARDKSAALFFTPSDYFACAYSLRKIFESDSLAESLSSKSRSLAISRNVATKLGDLQLDIYKHVLG